MTKKILNADSREFHADGRGYLRKSALDLRKSALKILSLSLLFFSVTASACLAAEPKMTAQGYYDRATQCFQEIETWKKEKNWEGVYDKGPDLKNRIAEDLAMAEPLAKNNATLLFEIKFLRWKSLFADDLDSAFGSFDGVVTAAKDAVASKEGLEAVKRAADSAKDFEDKNFSRRLYEAYAGSVMAAGLTTDELLKSADGFLSEGNTYLAKTLYEAFLAVSLDDKVAQAKKMISVADRFAHPGDKEALDPVYAEGLYQKAGDLAGDAAFESASQYRRAFNLERIKDYDAAIAQYVKLLTLFPDTPLKPEIYFRLGVFEAYVRKNKLVADAYFKKIVAEFPKDPLALSARYQAGILAQWNKETDLAKGSYDALLADVQARGLDPQKTELAVLAAERLKEMVDKAQMKHGLRLFMEGTFIPAEASAASLNVDLTAFPAKSRVNEAVKFVATTANSQTGCMTPTYAYEWSGEVGGIENIPNSPELMTAYAEKSLNVVSVAVVGPNGPEGVGFDLVQVN